MYMCAHIYYVYVTNNLPYTQEHLLAGSDSIPYCPTGPYCKYITERWGGGERGREGGGEGERGSFDKPLNHKEMTSN